MSAPADFVPTHPGEILKTEFLDPMGISQHRIAKAIDVPPRPINEIVHGKRGISADTGLRLPRALGPYRHVLDQYAGPLRRRNRTRAAGG